MFSETIPQTIFQDHKLRIFGFTSLNTASASLVSADIATKPSCTFAIRTQSFSKQAMTHSNFPALLSGVKLTAILVMKSGPVCMNARSSSSDVKLSIPERILENTTMPDSRARAVHLILAWRRNTSSGVNKLKLPRMALRHCNYDFLRRRTTVSRLAKLNTERKGVP
jgi:hypothetical protein